MIGILVKQNGSITSGDRYYDLLVGGNLSTLRCVGCFKNPSEEELKFLKDRLANTNGAQL